MTDETLIDQVIDRILNVLESADLTALAELLAHVPEPILRGFLPEV